MKDVQKILEKEHDFLHPEGKKAQYIKNLKSETDFDKTVSNNNKKIKCRIPLKKVLRNILPREWYVLISASIIAGLLGACGTGIIYEEEHYRYGSHLNQNHKPNAMIAWGVLSCLICFSVCIGGFKLIDEADRRDRIKDIYNRLSVRLFDCLKTIHPELDKSMLEKYNLALSDNITALLIANMNEADTKKLVAIADNLVSKLETQTFDENECKTTIDRAMGIIKTALKNNERLYDSIICAYKGWATSTFYLDPYTPTHYVYIAAKEKTH